MRHKDKKDIETELVEADVFDLPAAKMTVENNVIFISLNQYLSLYNRKHVLDNVIRKWFVRIDNTKPKKTKEEWDQIIDQFNKETA